MSNQQETKNCQNCKNDFTIESEDFSFYEKIKVPPPTFCPECRLVRRLSWINERNLYFSTCNLCKERMLSMYPPDTPYNIYCFSCYFSDNWDPLEYGVEFDFNKSFFEQFHELQFRVPRISVELGANNSSVNQHANHVFSRSKNIYLSYTMVRCEDCMYSKMGANGNKQCFDCLDFEANERCYELVKSSKNYESIYLTDSHSCVHSWFLYDCSNCTNCFMSTHLRNKSYVFRNVQLSPGQYLEKISQIMTDSASEFQKLKDGYTKMCLQTFKRYATIINSPKSTGDLIFNSMQVKSSFSVVDSKEIAYTTFCAGGASDSWDITYTGKGEKVYELAVSGGRNYNVLFSYRVIKCSNVLYSDSCSSESANLFGCIGLRKKKYCILNKQYKKEEYDLLLTRLVDHMNLHPYINKKGIIYKYGEFFPTEFSPFAYNESLSYEDFPLSREKVFNQGYAWHEKQTKTYQATISRSGIPDRTKDTQDNITEETLACPNKGKIESLCTSAFKIKQEEFNFYKRLKLPIPKYCPNCRYFERKNRKNPWKLWHRQCMCNKENHTNHENKCNMEFETSYDLDRSEVVYCEKCYKQEVY